MGRKRGRARSPFKLNLKKETGYSLAAMVFIILGLLVIVSFAGQGTFLKSLQTYLQTYFGTATLIVPYLLISAGLMFTQVKLRFTRPNVFLGAILIFIAVLGMLHSGAIGLALFDNLSILIQPFGAYILLTGIAASGFLIMTETSLDDFILFLGKLKSLFKKPEAALNLGQKTGTSIKFPIGSKPDFKIKGGPAFKNDNSVKKEAEKVTSTTPATTQASDQVIKNTPGHTPTVYTPPPLDLLEDKIGGEADRGDIKLNASIIEKTLDSFGIRAHVVEVNLGPAVTQYALQIALGTKLSRITTLQNDLALALAAPTGQIRIEAPIPGRSMVGIEIPNRSPEMVGLKRILIADQMKKNKSKTAVGLGLNVAGEVVVTDITKMPHVLIAGSTGSGKSVSVNAFILQLMYRSTPDEVKFILVDPKRVELTQYNGLPHLLTPVIVDPEKVVAALDWAVSEMEKRYKLFAEVGVKNIAGYNDISGFQSVPYIIVIIDELADIMLFAPNKVEDDITRLAQMARATGIHLMLATQRPSVDVITGLIKANIPCRIAFNVSSMIDSRVIIDGPGAEKLLGRGDMLYIPPDQAKPTRIQGTFVSDPETKRILDFLKKESLEVQYTDEVTTKFATKKIGGTDGEPATDLDPMFEEAVKIVSRQDKASSSLLQRKLSLGYARAARIMDQLEKAGVVGPPDGSKPREVLVKDAAAYLNKQ